MIRMSLFKCCRVGIGMHVLISHQRACHTDGRLFRKVKRNCFDTPQRLTDMEEQRINMQVLCTVPVMFHYWANPQHTHEISKELNDDLAETIGAHPPGRFVGLGTVPMNDSTLAVQELERCMNQVSARLVLYASHNSISVGVSRCSNWISCQRTNSSRSEHIPIF